MCLYTTNACHSISPIVYVLSFLLSFVSLSAHSPHPQPVAADGSLPGNGYIGGFFLLKMRFSFPLLPSAALWGSSDRWVFIILELSVHALLPF